MKFARFVSPEGTVFHVNPSLIEAVKSFDEVTYIIPSAAGSAYKVACSPIEAAKVLEEALND